ncbi:GNAT family N-acetyltransferase [Croceitalea vernalis]|uniref:GNAT family N-acetyltransferase n=1 Tax=Croceitalea vernalis TaxID=3075599 RepID=A0ABU3BII9_9FLAO|nr:GNAT family N-acetyltransferase [Croceitalea sp. P007]MDT0621983.1 GNAT family N-acetyltransferase [Croceitalea sp. P007]
MSYSNQITIIDFEEKYQEDFKKLNQWWIEKYFTMEKMDFQALDNPKEYIIDKGGYILIALLKGEAVGVCALIPTKLSDYDFELAKMGVAQNAQGHGIGYLLGKAVIHKARLNGAKRIHLESNTILAPAIRLYEKLGFNEVKGLPSPYERCNIQMDLNL